MGKKKNKNKPRQVGTDRPAGPGERELDSGLVYGRWYNGAPQDCPGRCFGVPEGQHVPPCPLNTSTYPEPDEAPATPEREAATGE